MGKRESGLAPDKKHVGLGKYSVYNDPVSADRDHAADKPIRHPIEDFSPLQVESILQSIAPMEYSRILHVAIATQINSKWRETACPNFNATVNRIFSPDEPKSDEDPQVVLGRKVIKGMRELGVMENASSVRQSLNVSAGVGSGWVTTRDVAKYSRIKVDLYNNLRALVHEGILDQDGNNNPLKFDHLDNCFHRYARIMAARTPRIDLQLVQKRYAQSKENESVAILLDFFMLADREIYSASVRPHEVMVAEKTIIARGDILKGKVQRTQLKDWYEEVLGAVNKAGEKVIPSTADLMADYILVGKNPFLKEGADDVLHLSSKVLIATLKRLEGDAAGPQRLVIIFELLRRNIQPLTRVLDNFVIPGMTKPDTFTLIARDGVDYGIEKRTRVNVDHLLFDHLSEAFQAIKKQPAEKHKPTLQIVFGEHKVGSNFQAALNEARLDNNIRIAQFLFMLFVRTRENGEQFDHWLDNEQSSFALLTKSGALSIVSKTNVLVQGENLTRALKEMQKLSTPASTEAVTRLTGTVSHQLGKPGLYTMQRVINPFENQWDREAIKGAFQRYLRKVEHKGREMLSLVDLATLEEDKEQVGP